MQPDTQSTQTARQTDKRIHIQSGPFFPPFFPSVLSAAVQSAAGHMTGPPALTEHAQSPQCCQAKYKTAVGAEICNR